jgi:PTS system N-acetylglucosamine-specific IIC component
MALMEALGVRLGFGFSAGLFDYVLNFSKATRPWLLLPVGVAYFAIYYGLFRWAIRRFDLKTPGREAVEAAAPAATIARPRGEAFVVALGGAANLASVDACTTRLRLTIRDPAAVDETALRGLGARGMVRPSADALQVVLGPQADQVAGEIRAHLAAVRLARGRVDIQGLRNALADVDLGTIQAIGSRLRLRVAAEHSLDEPALKRAGVRGIFRREGLLHLLIGPEALAVQAALATPSSSAVTDGRSGDGGTLV